MSTRPHLNWIRILDAGILRHNQDDFLDLTQRQEDSRDVTMGQPHSGGVNGSHTRPDELMQTALGHGTEWSDMSPAIHEQRELTIPEAARQMGISLSTFRRCVLPNIEVTRPSPGRVTIAPEQIARYQATHTAPGKRAQEAVDGNQRHRGRPSGGAAEHNGRA